MTTQYAYNRRTEFGAAARAYHLTVSLQEGYGEDGKLHDLSEVLEVLFRFAEEEKVPFGGDVCATLIFYSYESDGGRMVHAREPGVTIRGEFPPNKFRGWSDDQLVELVERLVGLLGNQLGQTSIHGVVCGAHHAWKRAGELTAREQAARGECPPSEQ